MGLKKLKGKFLKNEKLLWLKRKFCLRKCLILMRNKLQWS